MANRPRDNKTAFMKNTMLGGICWKSIEPSYSNSVGCDASHRSPFRTLSTYSPGARTVDSWDSQLNFCPRTSLQWSRASLPKIMSHSGVAHMPTLIEWPVMVRWGGSSVWRSRYSALKLVNSEWSSHLQQTFVENASLCNSFLCTIVFPSLHNPISSYFHTRIYFEHTPQ